MVTTTTTSWCIAACIVTVAFSVLPCTAQPLMTPNKRIALNKVTIEQPQRYKGVLPADASVNVPEGFKVSLFYAGASLRKPRFMAWSPAQVLHVADLDARAIFAMPDKDQDGVADTLYVAASNVVSHSIQFYKGDLYAAQERSVVRLRDTDGDGVYETQTTFIAPIAEGAQQPGGGHTTRTIVVDSLNDKFYLSIGSLCNVCRTDSNKADFQRALVEQWNADGTGRRTYVTGARNAVGLLQRGGRIWASNNGSDNQGNDVPPEWVDVLREGGFYGYPYAHSDGIYFNMGSTAPSDYKALLPLSASDSMKVESMVQPAALIQAHSAPMSLVSGHPLMPSPYRNGIFMALRGSWNRTPAVGGKIVYMDFDDENDTVANSVSDIVTGFMTDSAKSSGWGWARPVGLAVDAKGRLYIGSDANTRFILVMSPDSVTTVDRDRTDNGMSLRCDASGVLCVTFHQAPESRERLSIFNVHGECVADLDASAIRHNDLIRVPQLMQGMYFVRCTLLDGRVLTGQVAIVR